MPKVELNQVTNKPPFSAEILVRKESHELSTIKDDGYKGSTFVIEGGVMMKVNVTADTLESLQKKIAGHVALLE